METREDMANEIPGGASEDPWVVLEDAGAETEAAIVVGFLESQGIKATAMDRSFHQTPAQNDELMDIVIAVPASQLEAARAAMANRETGFASAKEGEETVLTEDGMVTLDEPAEPESGRES